MGAHAFGVIQAPSKRAEDFDLPVVVALFKAPARKLHLPRAVV